MPTRYESDEIQGDLGLARVFQEGMEAVEPVASVLVQPLKFAREALTIISENRKRALEVGGLALGAGILTGGVVAVHHRH